MFFCLLFSEPKVLILEHPMFSRKTCPNMVVPPGPSLQVGIVVESIDGVEEGIHHHLPRHSTPRGKALKVSLCEFIYWLVVSTPLKKHESQLKLLFPLHGKIKNIFQTTNQIYILIIFCIDYIDISIFYYILTEIYVNK